MKTEKKLKRGLTELSHLFGSPQKSGNGIIANVLTVGPYVLPSATTAQWVGLPPEPKSRKFIIAPPEDSAERGALRHLICATMIPVGAAFQMKDQMRLLDMLSGTFETSFFLSQLPTETELGPKPAVDHFLESDASKRSLVLFDPAFLNSSNDRMFSFLDHCVFVAPVDYEQFVHVYQLMQHGLARSPSLRYSLLIAGNGAKENWDFVYERFYEIVSHFLGCDLGFLGWMEGEEIRLNPDLLLDESGGAVQSFAKRRLSTFLAQAGVRV